MYLVYRADHNEEKEGGDALRYYRSPELQCPAKKRVKNFFKLLILIWLEYWQIVSQKCWGLKQMYKKEYPYNPFVEFTLLNSNDPHCLYGPRIIANLNWKGGCKKAGKMRKVGKISNLVGGEGGVGKYCGGKQKRQLQ